MLPEFLKPLALVDADLAAGIADTLRHRPQGIGDHDLSALVTDTLWAFGLDERFGRTVGLALARLAGQGPLDLARDYVQTVRRAADRGPTFSRFLAENLVAVLEAGLQDAFLAAVTVMRNKGEYTLEGPFEILGDLIRRCPPDAAPAYLGLLQTTFGKDIAYGRSRHFAKTLARAVMAMPVTRRAGQTRHVIRLMDVDPDLADAFIEGLAKGLGRLGDGALTEFGDRAIALFRNSSLAGRRFAALDSGAGLKALKCLQTAVTLTSQRMQLTRYVQARTAMPVGIAALSDLGPSVCEPMGPWVLACTDGCRIYLADEIAIHDRPATNALHYRILAALEAGAIEFGTFGFGLQKAIDLITAQGICLSTPAGQPEDVSLTGGDLAAFFALFPDPLLAADLFAVCEHGRIHALCQSAYPGLMRQALPLLRQRFWAAAGPRPGPLAMLYGRVALQLDPTVPDPAATGPVAIETLAGQIQAAFNHLLSDKGDIPVETCAALIFSGYGPMAALIDPVDDNRGALVEKLSGRALRPDLFAAANRPHLRHAKALQAALARAGIAVDTWPLTRHLIATGGSIDIAGIQAITGPLPALIDLSGDPAWSRIALLPTLPGGGEEPEQADRVFWYPEWDADTGDYLQRHCRVVEKRVGQGGPAFYRQFLTDNRGLVKKVRKAFERIKPAALQWQRRRVEGEIVDLGALVDFAVDRRNGRIPSDRLYNRRCLCHRNVAVLLLMDLSRSTAQVPDQGARPVLAVEKDAIILFGEALAVLGDSLSIAGFSSSGRLHVGYHCIKEFDDPLTPELWGGIGALTAQGATRMGGAIRHGVAKLGNWPAAIRLLIILSDGFPNDVDYKRTYAVADTRKAVAEARSRQIFTHAITVQPPAVMALDDSYGTLHHTVIADVGDLADRLLRVYAKLTRA